ncbi:Osmotically-inducible protein Y precursor [compost metagenome]
MARLDDLRQALLDAYAREPKVGSPNIKVTFLEDAVALTGEVSSLQAKEEAENLTRQIVPGLAIDNGLVITNNRPGDDQQLTQCAQQALFDAALDVGVKVLHGIAHLQGNVESLSTRDQAHHVVAKIPGIRSVRDEEAVIMGQQQVEVEPAYRQEGKFRVPSEAPQVVVGRDDITITNAIEELLATAMEVPRADEIHVWTHNGTVTLDGWVKTAEEAAQARLLAQRVSGVKSVQNRLVALDGSTGGDEALNQEVRRVFGAKDEVSPVDVLSVVVKQVAYLWGQVDTPEQRIKAEQLAQTVPGVLRVINNVQVVTRRSRPDKGPGGGR